MFLYSPNFLQYIIPISRRGITEKATFFFKFLAALGLCCCAWAFSSWGEQGLPFVVVRGFLTAVASLVVEHGL